MAGAQAQQQRLRTTSRHRGEKLFLPGPTAEREPPGKPRKVFGGYIPKPLAELHSNSVQRLIHWPAAKPRQEPSKVRKILVSETFKA